MDLVNRRNYYMTAELFEPTDFINREFAIVTQDGVMWRHLAFKNVNKLRVFLIEKAPLHVYFSVAKYKDPGNRDMIEKRRGWIGSDLIFDIDDDHLELPTLNMAASHALRLKYTLERQFGFEDMIVTFSGSRGYHFHVRDECVQSLDYYCRGEIVQYIVEKEEIGIDAPVTCNLASLIRLPGSIHGKTGKQCKIIDTLLDTKF